MSRLGKTMTACVLAGALGLAALTGCSSNNTAIDDEAAQNRQFMAQVNQIMVDMQSNLEGFSDAVGADDIVSMKTQADGAGDCVSALASLEAPDALTDIKEDYVEGATSLQQALEDYISLYGEIASASEDTPFDWGAYSDRVEGIRSSYAEGIAKLQAGDQAATEKE